MTILNIIHEYNLNKEYKGKLEGKFLNISNMNKN